MRFSLSRLVPLAASASCVLFASGVTAQSGAAVPAEASSKADHSGEPGSAKFAAPVRLLAAGKALGAQKLFPSPRLFDIDGDGVQEMVIGDLFGDVAVAERSKVSGEPHWGKLEPFMSGKRALKFSNW